MILIHLPPPVQILHSKLHLSGTQFAIQMIDRFHHLLIPRIIFLKDVQLPLRVRRNTQRHNSRLLILVPLPKYLLQSPYRHLHHIHIGIYRIRRGHHYISTVLIQILPKPIRVHKHYQRITAALLLPQLLSTTHSKRRHPLPQLLELSIHRFKRPRRRYRLLLRHMLDFNIPFTLQIPLQPKPHNRHMLPYPLLRHLRKIKSFMHPLRLQPCRVLPSNTPNITHIQPLQRLLKTHLRVNNMHTLRPFRKLLRNPIRHLSLRLRLSHPNAYRNSRTS